VRRVRDVAGTAVDETPQISDLVEQVRGLDQPSVAPLLATLQQILDSFVEIGLGYLSLDAGPSQLTSAAARPQMGIYRHSCDSHRLQTLRVGLVRGASEGPKGRIPRAFGVAPYRPG
jgi:hypothetical protein